MRATALLTLCAAALPGLARAEDNPACAKFEEPLAYNACLASHGPKATDIGGAARAAGSAPANPDAHKTAPAPRRVTGRATAVRRHARMHMEFNVR